MSNFISKWLYNSFKKAEREENTMKGCEVTSAPHPEEEFGKPLHITVYNAHGGKIVSFRHYDRVNDRSHEATYIIHPDEVFEESLGKLIAMEDLKRA